VSHQFPLVRPARGEQQQLGVLTLEARFDDVYRALREKAVVILTSQGATIFVASLFVLYLTHRLVTRHLTTLAGFLRHYDVLRPPPPLSLQRRRPTENDELDDVVAAFQTMRRTLEHAYTNLRESEQQLRDYAETASDWFWATGPAHEFTYVSEQIRAFGFDESELLGKRRLDIAADVAAEPQKWREHMATLERHEPFRRLRLSALASRWRATHRGGQRQARVRRRGSVCRLPRRRPRHHRVPARRGDAA
jgi:PAS domain-containing protein